MKFILCVAISACLIGCEREMGVRIDPQFFDRLAVVPLQSDAGIAAGLILEDGTVVSCLHVLSHESTVGQIVIMGHPVFYEIVARGDAHKETWSRWERGESQPPQLEQDWVMLRTEPELAASHWRPRPEYLNISNGAPAPGDRVYLIGYAAVDGEISRFQSAFRVISRPKTYASASASNGIFWLRTLEGSALRQGFSGAPILRRNRDDQWEICGIFVGPA